MPLVDIKSDQKDTKTQPTTAVKKVSPLIELIDRYLSRQSADQLQIQAKSLLKELYSDMLRYKKNIQSEIYREGYNYRNEAYQHVRDAYLLADYAKQIELNTEIPIDYQNRVLDGLIRMAAIIIDIRNPAVTHLDSGNHGLYDEDVLLLVGELRSNPHIISLDLCENNIGDIGGEALATLTTIKVLDLYRNNIRKSAAALAKSPIVKFNLSQNYLNEAAGVALATYARQLELDVSGNVDCGLTKETEKMIAEKIKSNNIQKQTVRIFETELLKTSNGILRSYSVEKITLAANRQSIVVYFKSEEEAINHQKWLELANSNGQPKLEFRVVANKIIFINRVKAAAEFLFFYGSISKNTLDLVYNALKTNSNSIGFLLAEYSTVHSVAVSMSHSDQSGVDSKAVHTSKKLSL